jgi:hypothetical protein
MVFPLVDESSASL